MWSQKEFQCLTYNHTHTSVLQFLFPRRKMWWFLTGHHHFHMLWENNGNNFFFFPLLLSWSWLKIWRRFVAWARGQEDQPKPGVMTLSQQPREISHHSSQICVFGMERAWRPFCDRGETSHRHEGLRHTFPLSVPKAETVSLNLL